MSKNEKQVDRFSIFKNCRMRVYYGKKWYVLKDICDNLDISDHKATRKNIDTDHVKKMPAEVGSKGGGTHEREVWYVTERAVIEHFLLGSHHLLKDKEEIINFRNWVVDILLDMKHSDDTITEVVGEITGERDSR